MKYQERRRSGDAAVPAETNPVATARRSKKMASIGIGYQVHIDNGEAVWTVSALRTIPDQVNRGPYILGHDVDLFRLGQGGIILETVNRERLTSAAAVADDHEPERGVDGEYACTECGLTVTGPNRGKVAATW